MNNLKEILAGQRRSQRWLAMTLGVAENTVSSWTTGKASPSGRMNALICDLLDISIDELYNPAGGKDADNGQG